MNLSLQSNLFSFSIGKQKPQQNQPERKPSDAQTREGYKDSVSALFDTYQPLKHNITLFSTIRSTFPFFDVAILKIIKLIGDPLFKSKSPSMQTLLDEFQENVQVNWFNRGINNWMVELYDSALETGMGFGELVPTKTFTDVHRLKTCKATDMAFIEKGGELVLASYDPMHIQAKLLERPDLVYYLALDQRQGHPQGYGLIYSCVYPAQVFYRWEKAIENYVIRFGTNPLVGIFEGGPNSTQIDINTAKSDFLSALKDVMQLQRKGQMADIAVGIPNGGKSDVRSIGADAKYAEMTDAVRTLLEQLMAKTHLPPYTFGVSWSARQTMSEDQADMLQSMIKAYRVRIEPILRNVIDTYLVLTGNAGTEWELDWGPVLLLDELKEAKTRLYNAQAAEKILLNLAFMLDYEFIKPNEIEDYLEQEGLASKTIKPEKDWWKGPQKNLYIKRMAKELLAA